MGGTLVALALILAAALGGYFYAKYEDRNVLRTCKKATAKAEAREQITAKTQEAVAKDKRELRQLYEETQERDRAMFELARQIIRGEVKVVFLDKIEEARWREIDEARTKFASRPGVTAEDFAAALAKIAGAEVQIRAVGTGKATAGG